MHTHIQRQTEQRRDTCSPNCMSLESGGMSSQCKETVLTVLTHSLSRWEVQTPNHECGRWHYSATREVNCAAKILYNADYAGQRPADVHLKLDAKCKCIVRGHNGTFNAHSLKCSLLLVLSLYTQLFVIKMNSWKVQLNYLSMGKTQTI